MMTLQQAAHLLLADLTRWRAHHPGASPRDMRAALDHRLQTLRTQLLRDLAPAAAIDQVVDVDAPTLPCNSFTRIGGRTLRRRRDATVGQP